MRNQEWDQSQEEDHMASGQEQEGSQEEEGETRGQTLMDDEDLASRDHTSHLRSKIFHHCFT